MWVCDQTDLPLGVCCCYLQTEERCIHHINEPHKKSTWEKTERNTEIKASRHFLRASVSMTETVKNIIHHYNNHNIITNFSCSQCLPICSSQPNNHMFVLGSLILNYAYYTFFLNVSVWGHPIAGTLKYVRGKCLYSVSVIPIPGATAGYSSRFAHSRQLGHHRVPPAEPKWQQLIFLKRIQTSY